MLHVHSDMDALAQHAARLLADMCRRAVAERGVFRMAVSGGSTPVHLFRLLAAQEWATTLPWDKMAIFWVDERCVAPDDVQSNFGMTRRELLERLPDGPATVWHARMEGELEPAVAADRYEDLLRREFGLAAEGLPRFDVILLGMGPDGHTASLFPGTTALEEQTRLVTSLYVPKVQSHRLTLTFPVLNNARCCCFMAAGADKHAALSRVCGQPDTPDMSHGPTLPAQRVRPTNGELLWLVDEAAAQGLA